MNKNIKSLRESILSALPLSMAKEYERMNRELNTDKKSDYYRKFKPVFDKAFGKDEKGRIIYRKYINVDNMPIDKEIEQFLKQNGYNITEEEFNAGVIIKNKDDKNNKYSLEELQKKGQVLRIGRILNKKKAPQKLILKWDKISKEISNKKLIVISRHPYDIAGQSTDRSWESCMTLETDEQEAGQYCYYVDSGIKAGVLIAYLISNDDKNINKPLARVLIKPYTNYNEVQFKVSKVYGVAGEEFKNTVQKWVNRNLNSKHIEVDEDMKQNYSLHLDTENIYNDDYEYNEYDEVEYFITENEVANKFKKLSNDKIFYKYTDEGTVYIDRNQQYTKYYITFNVSLNIKKDELVSLLNLQSHKIDSYIDIIDYYNLDYTLYKEDIYDNIDIDDDLPEEKMIEIVKEVLTKYIDYFPDYFDCDKFTQKILDELINYYLIDSYNRKVEVDDELANMLKSYINIDIPYLERLSLENIDIVPYDDITCTVYADARLLGSYETAYNKNTKSFFKYDTYGHYEDYIFNGVNATKYYEYDYELDL